MAAARAAVIGKPRGLSGGGREVGRGGCGVMAFFWDQDEETESGGGIFLESGLERARMKLTFSGSRSRLEKAGQNSAFFWN